MSAHWPSVDNLTPEAQVKWISGSWMILNPPVDVPMRQSQAQAAAHQFGTAVELELKSMVFEKFRDCVSQCSGLRSLVENKSSWGEDEKFFKFLVSQPPMKMPLGQMHRAFEDCKKSKGELLRKFNRWVQENRPALLKNLWVLKKICNIHNPAKHDGSIPIANAERMPHLCRKFLSALLSSPQRRTS